MKAFEYLSKPGSWVQGVLHSYDTEDETKVVASCALGAIICCYDDEKIRDAQVKKLEKYVQRKGYNSVCGWNDKKGQTRQEIVDGLKELDI